MLFEALTCPVCLCEYDHNDHVPRIILDCGHTVCSQCLAGFLAIPDKKRCPLDNRPFNAHFVTVESFPFNFVAKQLVDEKCKSELCKVHKEKVRLVCLTDRCKVCDDCVHFGDHKGHKIKLMSEIRHETNEKRSKLKDALKRLNKYQKDIEMLLEEKRTALIENVTDKFEEIRLVLLSKEFELTCKINTFFNREKDRLNSSLGMESNLRKELKKKIDDREDIFRDPNFFSIMEEDISVANKLDSTKLNNHLQEISKGIKDISELIDQILSAEMVSLDKLDLPIREFIETDYTSFLEEDKGNNHRLSELNKCLNTIEFKSHVGIKNNYDQLTISTTSKNLKDVSISPAEWKLAKVEFEIGKYKLLDENMKALCYVCYKLEKVPCMEVRFDPQSILDDHLLKLFPVIFWKAKDVEEVEIWLEKCKVGDKSIVFLFEKILSRMTSLKNLKLILDSTSITDRSLQVLAKNTLPLLKDLEGFRLDLFNVGISDEGMSQIFMKMEKIKSFRLHLQKTQITDKTIETFTKNTLLTMKGLEILELYLASTKVTDESVIPVLANIKKLKELKLILQSTNITDKSVEVFVDTALPQLKSLQFLSFDVNNTRVSGDKIDKINEIQTKLPLYKAYL